MTSSAREFLKYWLGTLFPVGCAEALEERDADLTRLARAQGIREAADAIGAVYPDEIADPILSAAIRRVEALRDQSGKDALAEEFFSAATSRRPKKLLLPERSYDVVSERVNVMTSSAKEPEICEAHYDCGTCAAYAKWHEDNVARLARAQGIREAAARAKERVSLYYSVPSLISDVREASAMEQHLLALLTQPDKDALAAHDKQIADEAY